MVLDDMNVEIAETVAVFETEVAANVAVLSIEAVVLIKVDVVELAVEVAVLMLAEVVVDPTEGCTCGTVAFAGSDDCMAVFCTTVDCDAGDAIFC